MPEPGSFRQHGAPERGQGGSGKRPTTSRTLSSKLGSLEILNFSTRCAGCHGVARDAAPSSGRRPAGKPTRALSSVSHPRAWSSGLCPEFAAPVSASVPGATASALAVRRYQQCRIWPTQPVPPIRLAATNLFVGRSSCSPVPGLPTGQLNTCWRFFAVCTRSDATLPTDSFVLRRWLVRQHE